MNINEAGLKLIKEFEGLKLQAYKDLGGIWTIGYGHVGPEAYNGAVITEQEANELLLDDLVRFEHGVNSLVKVQLNDCQFSALVCFAYNVGLGNLKSSTLMKLLNQGVGSKEVAAQFTRWSRVGGVVIPGLLRRREAEAALFLRI